MRSLAEPRVLKASVAAALVTSLACYPRLRLAPNLRHPIWYLEAVLFLGGIVLWAFVFAWQTQYTQRPVFTVRINPTLFLLVTATGIGAGLGLHFLVDPLLVERSPQEYPLTFEQWLAMTLFTLAFTQLFLVFAPFAWLVRLIKRPEPAMFLTVLFGIFVLAIKNRGVASPMPAALLAGLLLFRVLGGFLSVYFFLQGGVLLVSWWTLLVQCRHLFGDLLWN